LANGKLAIVFNGEIYNYAEIARELMAKGYVLKGHSDTEVILAAFREWGPSCVNRFIGMFAFAIWDEECKRLSLCRDRVGVKPLYYAFDGETVCFGSELKALRALPHWKPQVDQISLGEFLQYGYIAAPRTIYSGVHKLSPGSWLCWQVGGGAPEIKTYWSVGDALAKGPITGDLRAIEDELEALLIDAFRYRTVADVPVGLFLSGGIDSGLVAVLLRKAGISLEAFTIGFESAAHDESEAASALATKLGLNHRVSTISRSVAEGVFAQWPELYDEPFGDASGIPTYLVSRMAREKVKVALSADGGDELFCGYAGYPLLAGRMEAHARMPAALRCAGATALAAFTRGPLGNIGSPLVAGAHGALGHGLAYDRAQKMRDYLASPASLDAIRAFRTFFQQHEVVGLLGAPYADPRRCGLRIDGPPMHQLTMTDLVEYLPDDVLAKADRATMAVGLEGREPLLDHRVVEMAYRLPMSLRIGAYGNKHILRSILYRSVPRELIDRPKQGFAVPLFDWMDAWISKGAIGDSIDIIQRKLPGLDADRLRGQARSFAGSPQGKNRLWLIYVLGRWAERWL
jgi:asparagine synthase (glutamine-hydrolysing)